MLSDYQKSDGTIYHYDDSGNPEFGDGLARYSSWNLCEYVCADNNIDRHIIKNRFSQTARYFFLTSGEPVRHPSPGWWSMPGNCSGDQLEAYLSCCLAMNMNAEISSMFWKLFKRGFFAWNTKKIGQHDDKSKVPDFVLIRFLGLFLRNLCSLSILYSPLYFIIAVWDLLALPVATMVRCIKPLFDRDDTGDDLNYFHKLIAYYLILPTPISWMCRNFYYAFRPLSGTPEYRLRNKGCIGAITAFRCYYAGDRNPPLDIYLTNAVLKI